MITRETREIRDLAKTMNVSEISRATGRAYNTVKKVLGDSPAKKFDNNKWNPSEEELNTMKSWTGKDLRELSVIMNRSLPTLRKYMRSNGIHCPFRVKLPPKPFGPQIPRVRKERVAKPRVVNVKPVVPSVPRSIDGENRILEAMRRLGLK